MKTPAPAGVFIIYVLGLGSGKKIDPQILRGRLLHGSQRAGASVGSTGNGKTLLAFCNQTEVVRI